MGATEVWGRYLCQGFVSVTELELWEEIHCPVSSPWGHREIREIKAYVHEKFMQTMKVKHDYVEYIENSPKIYSHGFVLYTVNLNTFACFII